MLRGWNLFLQKVSKWCVIVLFVSSAVALMSKSVAKTTVIQGRVVAQAENNAEDFGSGSFLGYSQHYVFQIEDPHMRRRLVKIFYVFKNERDRLPVSYLDY